jgi:hypothetical protein
MAIATQVTLHEQAECLATQAFLRMHGLRFVLGELPHDPIITQPRQRTQCSFSDERANAEFMSLTSKLPLLKVDDHFVAGFEAIVSYARLRVSVPNIARKLN